ncbi:MAG: hypothetical protein ACK41W_15795, partial [Cyanobacteriota bacterium]
GQVAAGREREAQHPKGALKAIDGGGGGAQVAAGGRKRVATGPKAPAEATAECWGDANKGESGSG